MRKLTTDYPAGATEFPVGFWNFLTHIDQQPPAAVRDWADAGMTLTMGPWFGPQPTALKRMYAILDAAAERGIRLILCDSRLCDSSTFRSTLPAAGEKTYRAYFAQALKEFGKHPAVFGFFVGDEPTTELFEDSCRAVRILKEMAPHLSPYLNLYPWYQGVEKRVGTDNFAAYLNAYIEKARPDFLCYDCYSQMDPGTEGWDQYFRNLREYREAAARAGIPFWTILLSAAHFRYRCPTENDFRWQLNTALAHGAQGILYYFFYMNRTLENYRVSPVDEHGERTETFAWLSRVNRTFLKTQAATLRQLALKKVSHVGTAWGGWPLLLNETAPVRAKSFQGTPLIVSELRHANGSDHVMVVNNSQTESIQAWLKVSGREPKLHHIGWMAEEHHVKGGVCWEASHGADFVIVRPWLAPGQMEIYRVEYAGPARAT